MYDPLSIIALAVSVASAAFVIITKGFDVLLGHRESGETARRREEINAKLRAEVKKKEQEVMKTITIEKDVEKELEILVELGQSAFYARSITKKLLEGMTQRMGSALGFVSVTLVLFFITLFQGLNADLSNVNNFIPFFAFAFLTAFSFYATSKVLKGYYLLRERFLRLDENPTLTYCKELTEELTKEHIW